MSTAARYYGKQDVRIETVPSPTAGQTEAVVDVAACGICGSDLHEYASGPVVLPTEPHPMTGETIPLTLGHEFSGIVREVGPDAGDGIAIDDAVTVNPLLTCGSCRYCDRGLRHLCETVGSIGMTSGIDGGFAEAVAVPAGQLVPLPSGLPVELGALAEPLTVGLHAVRRSGLRPGETVAVFGAGPIGLAVLRAARAAGARTIVVSEPKASRREVARSLGADEVIDPTAIESVERIAGLTGGGVDVAFEVAGVESSLRNAIRSVERRGTVTIVSLFEQPISLDPNDIVLGERTLNGSRAYHAGPDAAREWETTLTALDKDHDWTDAFVTDRIPLTDIVDKGFERLLDEGSDQVKILVEP